MKNKKEGNHIQSEEIADLPVTTEQAEQAKGGESSTPGGSRIKGHHHVTLQWSA